MENVCVLMCTYNGESYLKEQIDSGAWKAGEKIPSENTLTKELGVSRASVRDAIRYFAGQGVLESRHGKGTFLLTVAAWAATFPVSFALSFLLSKVILTVFL